MYQLREGDKEICSTLCFHECAAANKSLQSCLCVTPYMAAHQVPPTLGFSRQEHWSGLPFPSAVYEFPGSFISILNRDNTKKRVNYSMIIEAHISKKYWLSEVIRL